MARKSKKDSGKLPEYQAKLRQLKEAEAELQKGQRELDLKIKKLKERIYGMPHHPFAPGPSKAGSRKR